MSTDGDLSKKCFIKNGPLSVAVLGVGYMGQNHARIYNMLPEANLIAVADIDPSRARAVASSCGCAAYTNTLDLFANHPELDAVSIAVPTIRHVEVALQALERNIPCLIEKPLAANLSEAEYIAAAAKSFDTIVQVGHIERFNPAIAAVSKLNLDPLFIKIDRVSPMPFRSLDVDVVLDIMIHDLDLILTLFSENCMPTSVDALGVQVNNSPVHLAQARLSFESGRLADLTASRIALQSKRRVRIFTSDTYISIDCIEPRATLLRLSDYLIAVEQAQKAIDKGDSLSETDLLKFVKTHELLPKDNIDKDFQLRQELLSFIGNVRAHSEPLANLIAGLKAVELADLIKTKMRLINTSKTEVERTNFHAI